MKIIVLGDVHGRTVWKEIINKENPDLTIFLGDYVSTHYDIGEEEQLDNLDEILDFKEQNPDKVVLLRGNHDLDATGYLWAGCLPEFECKGLFPLKRYEGLTQWGYVHDHFLFTHAGVSKTFLRNNGLDINDIMTLRPLEDKRFGFTPGSPMDYCGTSATQPPTWIRPSILLEDMPQGYTQVVGHTEQPQVNSRTSPSGETLWLCDALGHESYLCIEDGIATSKML